MFAKLKLSHKGLALVGTLLLLELFFVGALAALLNRAEEVVDREVNRLIAAPERHGRVVQMQRELQANHECSHARRWER